MTSEETLAQAASPSQLRSEDEKLQLVAGQRIVENRLAQDMNQMSLTERELVYEELHGVARVVEETPELVAQRLQALDQALREISSKPAYDQAEQICYEYVNNPKFRLMFLRADYFDAKKAAIRLVKFMEEKLRYFGPRALARSVFLSDLDEDDKENLRSGTLQILPGRDRSGRAVLCDALTMYPRCYKVARNMLKSFIYLVLCTAEDEETQRRGMVGLYFHMGPLGHQPDAELFLKAVRFPEWFPIRFAANHLCSNRPFMLTFVQLTLLHTSSEWRSRYRLHEGTQAECLYTLMTFGIPVDLCPVTLDGELKDSNHLKWIKKRQIKDRALKISGVFHKIDMPSRNDVLVGKGKPFQRHPGNVLLRQLVELRLAEYSGARKGEKTTLTRGTVQSIKDASGRFLKKDNDGWWVEVSDTDAREKVAKTFGSTLESAKPPRSQNPGLVYLGKEKRAKVQAGGCFGCCPSSPSTLGYLANNPP